MKRLLFSVLFFLALVACGASQPPTSVGEPGYELLSEHLLYDNALGNIDWLCNVKGESYEAGKVCFRRQILSEKECDSKGLTKPEEPGNWECVLDEYWQRQ